MAIHLVQDAEGNVHQIEAPDDASPDDVTAFAAQMMPIGGGGAQYQQPTPPAPSDYHMQDGSVPSMVGGTLAFGQGGMPIFDEAGAAAGASLQSAGFPYGKTDQTEWSKDYDKRLENIRNTEQAFANDYPKTDTVLRTTGAIAGTLPFSEALAARPVLGGSAYGGAQGFAGTDGNFYNRLLGGLAGGTLGGVSAFGIKTLIPPSVKAADNVFSGASNDPDALARVLTQKDLSPVLQKLDEGGVSVNQYAKNLANSTPDDFAGELGGANLSSYAMSNAKTANAGMQEARDAMRLRLHQSPQKAQQIIEDAFYPSSTKLPVVGADTGLSSAAPSDIAQVQQLRSNLSDIKDNLSDLYGATDEMTAPRRGLLSDLNTTQGQAAMARVLQRPSVQKMPISDTGIIKDPKTGFIGLKTNVPVPTLKMFAQELGDNAERDQFGKVTSALGHEEEAQGIDANDYIGSKVPEYAEAVNNAAALAQGENAFNQGRQLAHSAAGGTADSLTQRADEIFSPNELSYQKAGYAQGLSDKALSGFGSINKPLIVKTSQDFLGNDGAQQLADALSAHAEKLNFANKGLNNSVTSEVASNQAMSLPTSPHGLIHALLDKAKEFISPDRTGDVASYLYSTDPDQKLMLAKMLQNSAYYPQYLVNKPLAATALDIAPTMGGQYIMSRYNSPYSQGQNQ